MHPGSRFQLSCTKIASESLSTPPATRSSSMPTLSRRSVCTSVLTSYFLQRPTPAPAAFWAVYVNLFNGRATIHQAPHKSGVFRISIIWRGTFQRKTRRRKCLSSLRCFCQLKKSKLLSSCNRCCSVRRKGTQSHVAAGTEIILVITSWSASKSAADNHPPTDTLAPAKVALALPLLLHEMRRWISG